MAKSNSGQAIFEFVFFLPTMVIVFIMIVIIGNSINGSINQQKITRGYFYNTVHNDSKLPNRNIIRSLDSSRIGIYALGWCDFRDGKTPVAPCYKMLRFNNSGSSENCNPGETKGVNTNFIRVKTVYGVCATTYENQNGMIYENPQASYGACSNQ